MRIPTAGGRRSARAWPDWITDLGAFGTVGFLCFLLDLGLFQLLYVHVGAGAVTAKLLSTGSAMTVAFVGHRFWSFAHRRRTGLRREYVRFIAINVSTLSLGLALVAFVRYPLSQESALVLQLANVASIAVGTVIRFVAYRRWVFPEPPAPPAPVASAAATCQIPEPARPLGRG